MLCSIRAMRACHAPPWIPSTARRQERGQGPDGPHRMLACSAAKELCSVRVMLAPWCPSTARRQERGQGADGGRGRALRARLPRRRPGGAPPAGGTQAGRGQRRLPRSPACLPAHVLAAALLPHCSRAPGLLESHSRFPTLTESAAGGGGPRRLPAAGQACAALPTRVSSATPPTLQEEAGRVGFPLLVKAVMGGGGKGMKLARRPAEFLVRF